MFIKQTKAKLFLTQCLTVLFLCNSWFRFENTRYSTVDNFLARNYTTSEGNYKPAQNFKIIILFAKMQFQVKM